MTSHHNDKMNLKRRATWLSGAAVGRNTVPPSLLRTQSAGENPNLVFARHDCTRSSQKS